MTVQPKPQGTAVQTSSLDRQITAVRFDAILFDLDGVLTSTAKVHAACWKQTFDAFLRARSAKKSEPFRAFDSDVDYRDFVDGKSRYDGVRSFLASRNIVLPEGTPASPTNEESVCGLGNKKEELVSREIHANGVSTYPGAMTFLKWSRAMGLLTAVVSSSRNCSEVLHAAGIDHLFDVQVNGELVAELHLQGKPAPDSYLYAAKLLNVLPTRAVVVEDAIAGVSAGRAGRFGLVIGVDRKGAPEELLRNGADFAVSDLSDLIEPKAEGAQQ